MLGQFAELFGNSFGSGKCDRGVSDRSPAELVPDCVDGPVHAPSRGFDDGFDLGVRISTQVVRIEGQLELQRMLRAQAGERNCDQRDCAFSFVIVDG